MKKVGILDLILTELFAPSCCVFRSRVPKKQSRWYPLIVVVVGVVVVVVCVQIQSAKEAVKTVLDHMTNPQTSTHLQLQKGDGPFAFFVCFCFCFCFLHVC